MSSLHIRNVQMCRDLRPGSTRYPVTESHEHHQSDIPGSVEPKITRRDSKRAGKEARRCAESVLRRAGIALYHQDLHILYIGHHGIA